MAKLTIGNPANSAGDHEEPARGELEPEGITNTPENLQAFAERAGMRVNEPLRPDLQPGETVTTTPERWCPNCETARAGRKCPVCRALTLAEAPEPEPEEEDDPEEEERFERMEQTRAELEQRRGGAVAGAHRDTSRWDPPRPRVQAEPTMERSTRLQRTPPANRGRQERFVMQQRRRQRASAQGGYQDGDFDDMGRVVQITRGRGAGRGNRGMPAEQRLANMWVNGQIDLEVWSKLYAATITATGAQNEAEIEYAAQLTDAAYLEIISRQEG